MGMLDDLSLPFPQGDLAEHVSDLADMYTIPAQGLGSLEGGRYGIHVVDAKPGDDFELVKGFGEQGTVRVNGANFIPEHFDNQVNILSGRGATPVRVVVHNLGMIKPDFVHDFERIMNPQNGYPIKTIYFMDTGDMVTPGFFDKVLTCCDDAVDSQTLLDAVAFGWGTKNVYQGQPKQKPFGQDHLPSDQPLADQGEDVVDLPNAAPGPPDFIPSDEPLYVDSEDSTYAGF